MKISKTLIIIILFSINFNSCYEKEDIQKNPELYKQEFIMKNNTNNNITTNESPYIGNSYNNETREYDTPGYESGNNLNNGLIDAGDVAGGMHGGAIKH